MQAGCRPIQHMEVVALSIHLEEYARLCQVPAEFCENAVQPPHGDRHRFADNDISLRGQEGGQFRVGGEIESLFSVSIPQCVGMPFPRRIPPPATHELCERMWI